MRYQKVLCSLLLSSAIIFTSVADAQEVEVSKSHKASKHKNKSAPRSKSTSESSGGVFNEGTLEVDLGIGFWGNYNYNYWDGYNGYWSGWDWNRWNGWNGWNGRGYNSFVSPSFHLSLDYGVKRAGPGTFGLGATLAIKTASWGLPGVAPTDRDFDYFGGYIPYKHRWTDIILGARGTYHLDLPKAPKFDLYFGLMLGVRITQYHYEGYQLTSWWPPPYPYYKVENNITRTYPVGGLFLGCKYFFTDNLGIFGEVGWDVAAFKFGLAIKM